MLCLETLFNNLGLAVKVVPVSSFILGETVHIISFLISPSLSEFIIRLCVRSEDGQKRKFSAILNFSDIFHSHPSESPVVGVGCEFAPPPAPSCLQQIQSWISGMKMMGENVSTR